MVHMASSPAHRSAKRHLWLASLLYPCTPLLPLGLVFATGNAAWIWLTTAIIYILLPIADHLIGEAKVVYFSWDPETGSPRRDRALTRVR